MYFTGSPLSERGHGVAGSPLSENGHGVAGSPLSERGHGVAGSPLSNFSRYRDIHYYVCILYIVSMKNT